MAIIPDPPFGPAVAGRGLLVWFRVDEPDADDVVEPKNLTSRWSYEIRAWADSDAATAFVYRDPLTKEDQVTRPGWLKHWLQLGATARTALRWELVEIDGDNASDPTSATPSGKVEIILHQWTQAVDPAAQTGP